MRHRHERADIIDEKHRVPREHAEAPLPHLGKPALIFRLEIRTGLCKARERSTAAERLLQDGVRERGRRLQRLQLLHQALIQIVRQGFPARRHAGADVVALGAEPEQMPIQRAAGGIERAHKGGIIRRGLRLQILPQRRHDGIVQQGAKDGERIEPLFEF